MWNVSITKKKKKMVEVIQKLEQLYPKSPDLSIMETYSLLIATILSQNTSANNSSKAFNNLQSKYEIKPHVLAKLNPKELKPLIRVAGLHNIRSERIIEVSRKIIELFNGNLDIIIQLPIYKARSKLLSVKGIGPKTVDILLAFKGKKAIIPIDTNIFRFTERLGLVTGRSYEKTRAALEDLIPKKKMKNVHLIIIKHGRTICKPRNPLCFKCPLKNLCQYFINSFNTNN